MVTPTESTRPLPHIRIDAKGRPFKVILQEIWEYRDMLWFLAWRDISVRYKQAVLGAAWVVLQPFMLMLTFSFFIGHLVGINTGNIPYPVHIFTGLLVWGLFVNALGKTSDCIIANGGMISKVYFPRLVIPLSSVLPAVIDFAYTLIVCLCIMLFYHIVPNWRLITLPLFVLLTLITALGVGLWLAVLSVRYRDITHLLPVIIQIWMYCSPIMYPLARVPANIRWIYCLNPMVGVIEGARWALLRETMVVVGPLCISTCVACAILAGGIRFFRRNETRFADYL